MYLNEGARHCFTTGRDAPIGQRFRHERGMYVVKDFNTIGRRKYKVHLEEARVGIKRGKS